MQIAVRQASQRGSPADTAGRREETQMTEPRTDLVGIEVVRPEPGRSGRVLFDVLVDLSGDALHEPARLRLRVEGAGGSFDTAARAARQALARIGRHLAEVPS